MAGLLKAADAVCCIEKHFDGKGVCWKPIVIDCYNQDFQYWWTDEAI
jgi:hypothetical protein